MALEDSNEMIGEDEGDREKEKRIGVGVIWWIIIGRMDAEESNDPFPKCPGNNEEQEGVRLRMKKHKTRNNVVCTVEQEGKKNQLPPCNCRKLDSNKERQKGVNG
jgi:hypothetical protein